MRQWILCAIVVLLSSSHGVSAAPGKVPPASSPTQGIMQSLFEPMSRALMHSFDQQEFSSPKHRAAIQADLRALVKNVGKLKEHASHQDRAFEYVAKSLARDAVRLERWYEMGRYEEANFILHHMTENCIACHSSLPESRRFPAAEKFFAKVDTKQLNPLERAQFQVMSRRFDDALGTYEAYFRSHAIEPSLISLLGAFGDYLKLSISVKSDFNRPQATIEYLASLPGTSQLTKQQLGKWLLVLKEFEASKPLAKGDLATARKVLADARTMMEFPKDRDGLVHYVTAEAILARLVRGTSDRGRDIGEAYYLLGIASSMTEHSFWISRSDFYLESAIRLAPSASFAPKAYALLEESMTLNNSGSGGIRIPDEERALLLELKMLVEQEHGKI